MPACPTNCGCHTNPYAPCTTSGGCGSEGCTQPAGTCSACHRNDPEHGLVCEPCRRWLPNALNSILGLTERLHDDLIPDDDSSSRPVLICAGCGLTTPFTATPRHDDHPEHDDPTDKKWHGGWTPRHLIRRTAGPTHTAATDEIITTGGNTEASTPLNLHIHDLLADVVRDGGRPIDTTGDNWVQALTVTPRAIRVDNGPKGFTTVTVLDRTPARDHNGYRRMIPAGDQIGSISVAQLLDQEVRAWIDAGAPGSRWRPTPTITSLVNWLTNRLHWACDHYPALDAFADTLKTIRGQLMGALGDFDPDAELCDGVACDKCHLLMLYRRQDGSGDVECQNPDCWRVLTAEQYRDHTRNEGTQLRAKHRKQRQEPVAA